MAEVRRVRLFCIDPSVNTDKVYIASMDSGPGGWTVTCEWGRRGSTLQKKEFPFSYGSVAQGFLEDKIQEKLSKGYRYQQIPVVTGNEDPFGDRPVYGAPVETGLLRQSIRSAQEETILRNPRTQATYTHIPWTKPQRKANPEPEPAKRRKFRFD